MNKKIEEKILIDCSIIFRKIGDVPFDKALQYFQNDLWEIGARYNITGIEVFNIMMKNFEKVK